MRITCTCSACGRNVRYGDESPMIKDELWNQVLEYHSLRDIDAEKKILDAYLLATAKRAALLGLGGIRKEIFLVRKRNFESLATYICSDCMEQALGRPLQYDDLRTSSEGEDLPINKEVIKRIKKEE